MPSCRWIFLICTLALWVLIFTATFVGLAPRTAEVRAVLRCFVSSADQRSLSTQRVLGKPLIAEMHARGEQLDEFIRRYQRYKPEIKFEPGTPEVSPSYMRCVQHIANRVLTCHVYALHPRSSLSMWCRQESATGLRAWPKQSAPPAVQSLGSCSGRTGGQHKRCTNKH